ncbi:Na+/H+ antiporter NhaC [Wenzhouxiangella limi]|uniref:Na+/H+ antiporter NhaC n=1 Tax=Wenzhouxiangella limi TaxID=2707351 RepID=A0A845UW03_9GAMM|nr:Na+/H+ antiporter NhaC [Wenzhouxiangella limi]NDY94778.1 Na+/H+ antiporter NhaC [Wenzhouxiangella limi]
MTSAKRTPSYLQALVPLIALIAMLAASVWLFGDSSSYGPNQIALLIAAAIGSLIALTNGYHWDEIQAGIVEGISIALGAILIILMVGALIGTWLLAGVVPTLIYYGLELLNPAWFYAASCLICAIVSLSIGSSWTTAATIGVALIGVAVGLDQSLPITAGAVLSGAYFGDKMSPLSDTTNLAPAVAGTELFAHIRYMAWVSVPALAISLLAYLLIGGGSEVLADAGGLAAMQQQLDALFNINVFMLVPLVVLFGLAVARMPALPSIFIGALLGAVWALVFQPDRVAAMAQGDGLLAAVEVAWLTLADGTEISSGDADLDRLLSGGGMSSMLNTVWLALCAMTFGAVMESTGLLRKLLAGIAGMVQSTTSLVTTTILTAFGTNVMTADQYMAIVLPGRMFRAEFRHRGLDPRVLSRSLEGGGTITSPLVPWNTCAVYMFGVLGVSPLQYAPYAFFLLLVPLIGILYAALDFKILRLDPAR